MNPSECKIKLYQRRLLDRRWLERYELRASRCEGAFGAGQARAGKLYRGQRLLCDNRTKSATLWQAVSVSDKSPDYLRRRRNTAHNSRKRRFGKSTAYTGFPNRSRSALRSGSRRKVTIRKLRINLTICTAGRTIYMRKIRHRSHPTGRDNLAAQSESCPAALLIPSEPYPKPYSMPMSVRANIVGA